MEESKLTGKTKDIVSENIFKLKEIFPDIFAEDKIDFDKLKLDLGEYVDDSHERYNFTWPGKTQAIKESQKQSTGTLRPCKEESKNWDDTKNLYIEGDNLEVLKLLQKAYYNKIKMIYIDPPYNTGKDFIYSDNYQDNLENYLELTHQTARDNAYSIKLTNNVETNGRFHSDWLNMIYPRLKLARNLLSEDGVIFISIDDNEVENLTKVCNEIFGEENFVSTIIWEKNFAPKNDNKYISVSHEYALCYAKYKDNFKRNLLPRTEEHNKGYKNPDNDERGVWSSGTMLATTFSEKYVFGIEKPNGEIAYPPEGRCWRFSKEKIQELIKDNRIWFGKDGKNVPRIKRFLTEVPDGIVPQSLWKHTEVGNNQNATNDLKKIFSGKHIFTFPKPINFMKKMIHIGLNENDFILDFFGGSGTTAHAIMDINKEKNTNRKFIIVQIPEEIDEKSEAFKSGFKTISEIGKERINRVGDIIIEETNNPNLDIGFKVFKLDSSNLEKWDPDYNNIQQSLTVDQIKQDRTDEDLVYEIMLKYGIDLTFPIEEHSNIYSIGFGALIICLDDNITKDTAKEVLKLTNNSSISRVVFKDSGFATDADKTNIKEILKNNHIDEFITI